MYTRFGAGARLEASAEARELLNSVFAPVEAAEAGLHQYGVPFDERQGVICNAGGRVLDDAGRPLPGEYVVGGIKREPSGVIGTNKKVRRRHADGAPDRPQPVVRECAD